MQNEHTVDSNTKQTCEVSLSEIWTSLYDRTALQEDIDTIVAWTSNWLMKLNIDKCKHMEIGNKTNNSSYILDNGATTISKVNSEKDLGITYMYRCVSALITLFNTPVFDIL